VLREEAQAGEKVRASLLVQLQAAESKRSCPALLSPPLSLASRCFRHGAVAAVVCVCVCACAPGPVSVHPVPLCRRVWSLAERALVRISRGRDGKMFSHAGQCGQRWAARRSRTLPSGSFCFSLSSATSLYRSSCTPAHSGSGQSRCRTHETHKVANGARTRPAPGFAERKSASAADAREGSQDASAAHVRRARRGAVPRLPGFRQETHSP
jgi:hypothetical protein